ncbi:Methyltransferase-like protein [Astathelohania contejeani]|uniref:tRNA N(3)-methylcytidine methyltransferase n=1 Tax=Astathelohania contejeani TaxID=164912 RepID=A0ABQ7I1F6_9MICR|nr:Methyltransferase-like protein [Thelohania contejeani]
MTRHLIDENKKFIENAWDDASLTPERLLVALNKIEEDEKSIKEKTLVEPTQKEWDHFYKNHNDRFFKDRNWILKEFTEVNKNKKILEVGCGTGNTLSTLDFERNKIYGCDFSSIAIEIAKDRFPKGTFFIYDITSDNDFPYSGFDIVFLIYTLSAIPPHLHIKVVNKLTSILNPGGIICFKDYGRLDMVQLRYKSEQIIDQNLYRRKDGTITYFFTTEALENLFKEYEIRNLFEDKRLIINRKKKLEMYRIWIQGEFKKKLNI